MHATDIDTRAAAAAAHAFRGTTAEGRNGCAVDTARSSCAFRGNAADGKNGCATAAARSSWSNVLYHCNLADKTTADRYTATAI